MLHSSLKGVISDVDTLSKSSNIQFFDFFETVKNRKNKRRRQEINIEGGGVEHKISRLTFHYKI